MQPPPLLTTLHATTSPVDHTVCSLPPKLGSMHNLKSLSLDGNPLKTIRLAVIQKGTFEILKYLRSRIVGMYTVGVHLTYCLKEMSHDSDMTVT